MLKANEIVDNFLEPYLDKYHPNADIVILAGSFGRAMKDGGYEPVASSDIDLVIIYSDLEKAGYKAATQIFTLEDVGMAMRQDSHVMMIDINIHDFASLHYHNQVVKDVTNFAFINVMIDEGYVLIDKKNIAKSLQKKAIKFLQEGPSLRPRKQWQAETDRMSLYLDDLSKTTSIEEKRFLGLMCLMHVCEYSLGLHDYWRSGNNQAYRCLAKYLPIEEKRITSSFSKLLKTGDSKKVEILMENYILLGKEKIETLPYDYCNIPYPIDRFVPANEVKAMDNMFLKFMTEHLCGALETSKNRGELAYFENLSATTSFIKRIIEEKSGHKNKDGIEGMKYLCHEMSDFLPAIMNAINDNEYVGMRNLADKALSHMGGIHYKHIENYYPEDVARFYALKQRDGLMNKTINFKPRYKV